MAATSPNPIREKSDLLKVLGLPNPANLFVRNGITAELQIRAADPAGVLPEVVLSLQPSRGPNDRVYDLLVYAPVEWWRASTSLLEAVQDALLFVDLEISQQAGAEALTEASLFDLFIARPPIETLGDMIVWNGSAWVVISGGADGQVLTYNSPGLPTWETPQSTTALAMATGESTDASIYEVLGAFSLNGDDYVSSTYTTLAAVTDGALTGEIQLYNLTDATQVALHTYNGITSPTEQNTVVALTSGERIYEVRARVTGGTPPSDRVLVTWAGLELVRG